MSEPIFMLVSVATKYGEEQNITTIVWLSAGGEENRLRSADPPTDSFEAAKVNCTAIILEDAEPDIYVNRSLQLVSQGHTKAGPYWSATAQYTFDESHQRGARISAEAWFLPRLTDAWNTLQQEAKAYVEGERSQLSLFDEVEKED